MGLIRRSGPALQFYLEEAAILTAKAAAVPIMLASTYLITLVSLIGIGALLIIIRRLFLVSCPYLAEHAKITAAFIDVIILTLDILKGVVVVIEDAIDGIADLFGADLSPPRFVPIKFVNVETLRRMLLEAPVACAAYDNVFDIIAGSFRLAVGQPLCETLRYLYPVPWLYDLATFFLGWASLDPMPLPDKSQSNCEGDPDEIVFCMGLGSGYVLVEFLVPMVLLVVTASLLLTLLKVLINFGIDGIEAGRHFILDALGVVKKTTEKAENKLVGLEPPRKQYEQNLPLRTRNTVKTIPQKN